MSGDAHDPALLAAARTSLERCAAVVCHTDADGLAAGAIALRARGERAADAVLPSLGRGPWPAPLPGGDQEAVAVLDLGVRALARPALLVDHHAPEAAAGPGQLVVSGHGEVPQTCTSALMGRVRPDAPAWLVALGAFGDLGAAGLALPEAAGAPRTAVRRLAPLVNAPRRMRDGDPRVALELLVEHDDPSEALADPRVVRLQEARAITREAFERAVRTAPRVAGDVAVVRFDEPFQVHPLVATTWQRRLAPRMVLAANDGWVPGRVNFAVRGGGPGADLRARLRDALPEAVADGSEFAHGHPQATGGSLAPEAFGLLLERLGVARGDQRPDSLER